MNKRLLIRLLLLLCSVFISGISAADESEVQVAIKTWLGTAPNEETPVFAPTQQIILNVQVSTNTWYTAGTKIAPIEIPDVLVKQRNPFAINSTQRDKGQTWSRQLWEIVLYPQKSGDFVVPPVSVAVQVAGNDGNKKNATLTTNPLNFSVELPAAELSDSLPWFTASKAEVEQEWEVANEENFKVGDSITRKITIQAEDSLSVLLPTVMKEEVTPLWQVYPGLPELVDKQNRDGYVSMRTDSHTYIVQQGGDITLPDYEVWWWNAKQKSVEKIVIEGKTFHVKHTLASWLKAYGDVVLICIVAVVGLCALLFMTRRYYQTHAKPEWVRFYTALLRGHWPHTRTLLYKKARLTRNQASIASLEDNKQWHSEVFQMQSESVKRSTMVYLWRRMKRKAGLRLSIPKALPQLDTKNNQINHR